MVELNGMRCECSKERIKQATGNGDECLLHEEQRCRIVLPVVDLVEEVIHLLLSGGYVSLVGDKK